MEMEMGGGKNEIGCFESKCEPKKQKKNPPKRRQNGTFFFFFLFSQNECEPLVKWGSQWGTSIGLLTRVFFDGCSEHVSQADSRTWHVQTVYRVW